MIDFKFFNGDIKLHHSKMNLIINENTCDLKLNQNLKILNTLNINEG